jgi:predicted ATP-dependent endonuclease of OLD family
MYKIQSVKIDNFWHRFNASGEFNEDVNIIIGQNGTGKTTFMNILHSVLSVDVDGISANDFDSVAITLVSNRKTKTVKVSKLLDDKASFLNVAYQISNKKHNIRIFPTENERMTSHFRRRSMAESEDLREELSKLVSLSSLSVYRLRSGQDYEVSDVHGRRAVSPVDHRLSELLQGLTHYQLELSQQARTIATKLQRDVLTSILYSKDESTHQGIPLEFDKNAERESLVSAYTQLNVIDTIVQNKIGFHVDAIDKTVTDFKSYRHTTPTPEKGESVKVDIDFRPLEAFQQTRKIIKMSLDAETETSIIFSQISLFTEIVGEFIRDKNFYFRGGDLQIEAYNEKIHYNGLSSGEKQLLIILIETLLQRQKNYIFLTDEPELSLHISWQRQIIPAVKRLNPKAQIIAATHSPEVASQYLSSIIDMKELIDG